MIKNEITINIPQNELLTTQGIDAIRIFCSNGSSLELVGKTGAFPKDISALEGVSITFSSPSVAFTKKQGMGMLTVAMGKNVSVVLQAILTKGPIHRQLNLANKFLSVIETILSNIADGKTQLDFDWSAFEASQMNLKKARLPPDVEPALSHVLTKKPVIIVGSNYEEVFATLFVLVSPINQPLYRDVSWAINPMKLGEKYHFLAYSDTHLMREQNPENMLNEDNIVKVLIDEDRCTGESSSSMVRKIGEALKTSSIEEISSILKTTFAKAREAKSFENLQAFKEESDVNAEDAMFLWDLATRVL